MATAVENLESAFAGESQANRKYTAFAKKADQEGYPQVARLFRAAASAETVHALNHFRAKGGVKSTEENLKEAVAGETYEVDSMYPPFLAEAEAEGDRKAAQSFKYALEVEIEHAALYKEALASLGKDEETYEYYVCPVCGSTHARRAPEECPVCGTSGSKFEKIF